MDMSGNVWEWVLSEYKAYPYDGNDGRNDNLDSTNVLRGLRGGSWYSSGSTVFRSADRNGDYPNVTFDSFGGRCSRFNLGS